MIVGVEETWKSVIGKMHTGPFTVVDKVVFSFSDINLYMVRS